MVWTLELPRARIWSATCSSMCSAVPAMPHMFTTCGASQPNTVTAPAGAVTPRRFVQRLPGRVLGLVGDAIRDAARVAHHLLHRAGVGRRRRGSSVTRRMARPIDQVGAGAATAEDGLRRRHAEVTHGSPRHDHERPVGMGRGHDAGQVERRLDACACSAVITTGMCSGRQPAMAALAAMASTVPGSTARRDGSEHGVAGQPATGDKGVDHRALRWERGQAVGQTEAIAQLRPFGPLDLRRHGETLEGHVGHRTDVLAHATPPLHRPAPKRRWYPAAPGRVQPSRYPSTRWRAMTSSSGSAPSPGPDGTFTRPLCMATQAGNRAASSSTYDALEHRRLRHGGEDVQRREEPGPEAGAVGRNGDAIGLGQRDHLAHLGDTPDLGDVGLGHVDGVDLEEMAEVEDGGHVLAGRDAQTGLAQPGQPDVVLRRPDRVLDPAQVEGGQPVARRSASSRVHAQLTSSMSPTSGPMASPRRPRGPPRVRAA